MTTRGVAIVFVIVLAIGAVISAAVRAHGDAAWIASNSRYVDQNGLHCCGIADCRRDQAVNFRESPEGIWVSTGAGDEVLVPRDLVGRGLYPSIDDWWWICIRAGVVRCIFKPTSGT